MATRTRSRSGERQSQTRFGSIQRLFHDTVAELRKVTWPDRETTRNLTIVVIAISVALGALLGGIDAIFIRLWEAIPSL